MAAAPSPPQIAYSSIRPQARGCYHDQPHRRRDAPMATKETVEAYLAAWNEKDEAKRTKLLDKCWADSGTYTDPMSDVAGREQLAALIGQFHQQMPGAGIALTSAIDEHHGRIR